jgi:hypothetical protein
MEKVESANFFYQFKKKCKKFYQCNYGMFFSISRENNFIETISIPDFPVCILFCKGAKG